MGPNHFLNMKINKQCIINIEGAKENKDCKKENTSKEILLANKIFNN
jgi:hypothetical protein